MIRYYVDYQGADLTGGPFAVANILNWLAAAHGYLTPFTVVTLRARLEAGEERVAFEDTDRPGTYYTMRRAP